jgi:hypothetical protein
MPMRAFLIDGQAKTVDVMDLDSMDNIAGLVGCDSVISDDVDDSNVVHFDEDCFIRGTPGRFRIDRLAPIAGKAVIVGKGADGAAADSSLELEQLRARVEFL